MLVISEGSEHIDEGNEGVDIVCIIFRKNRGKL